MKRARVGNVEVIALVDMTRPMPASAVYPEAAEAIRPLQGYLDSEGRLVLNFGCFLLRDGGQTILVDAGNGPEAGGRLMEEISEAGVSPESIDAVVFTHLHGDHTGWNLDRATGAPRFPRARYLVPQGDWDHYGSRDPKPRSFERDVVPLEATGQMVLFAGEHTVSPSLTAIPTPGHTPGHSSVVISSNGEKGLILGDVVISRIDAELPDLSNTFDWDHAIARDTRRKMLDRLTGDGSLVGASHIAAPGLGRFVRSGERTRWEPLA